jgi:hypothetical protein
MVKADQSVSLAWDAAPGTNVTGYCLYYGTTSGTYSNKVDVGNNTSVTITGLKGQAVNYYFIATAYDTNRMEGPPSNQALFTTSSNAGPTLASLPGVTAGVRTPVIINNSATDPELPAKQLTYSLDPGAPATMRIQPSTGRIVWVPDIGDGGKTNFVNVRVSDGGTPNLYSVQTVAIAVSNAVHVGLGTTILALGQAGSLPITLNSSTGVTNVTFALDVPYGRVTNVSVVSLIPGTVTVTQQAAGQGRYTITLRASGSSPLSGVQSVAQINFTASSGKPSSFGGFASSTVAAMQSGGAQVPSAFGSSGEVVLVGAESLVRTISQPNGRRDLIVFGPTGKSFQVQTSSNPTSTNGWTPVLTTGLMSSSLYQTFTNFAPVTSLKYYRTLGL